VTEYADFCVAFNSLNLTELCESYHMHLIDKQQTDASGIEMESAGANAGSDDDRCHSIGSR